MINELNAQKYLEQLEEQRQRIIQNKAYYGILKAENIDVIEVR